MAIWPMFFFFFIIKTIANLINTCYQYKRNPDGYGVARGWCICGRSSSNQGKGWACFAEQITFSSQCWALSNIAVWKNTHIVHAGQPGKEQNVPFRIYLRLNQLYLKGVVFHIVFPVQEAFCSSGHPITGEPKWYEFLQIHIVDKISHLFLIFKCCAI